MASKNVFHCLDDKYLIDAKGREYRGLLCGVKSGAYVDHCNWLEYKGPKCPECDAVFQAWWQDLKRKCREHQPTAAERKKSLCDFARVNAWVGV